MNEQEFNDSLVKMTGYARGMAARIPTNAVVDHDDMVQEALLSVWAKRDVYVKMDNATFATFAYNRLKWGTLAGRQAGDWKGKGQKDTGQELTELFDDTDVAMPEDESLREILLSMDSLSLQQKRSLILYLAGFRIVDIANLLKVKESTANEFVETAAKKVFGIHDTRLNRSKAAERREAAKVSLAKLTSDRPKLI